MKPQHIGRLVYALTNCSPPTTTTTPTRTTTLAVGRDGFAAGKSIKLDKILKYLKFIFQVKIMFSDSVGIAGGIESREGGRERGIKLRDGGLADEVAGGGLAEKVVGVLQMN